MGEPSSAEQDFSYARHERDGVARAVVVGASRLLAEATSVLIAAGGRLTAYASVNGSSPDGAPPDLVVFDTGAEQATALAVAGRLNGELPIVLLAPPGARWTDELAAVVGAAGCLTYATTADGLCTALEEVHREGTINSRPAYPRSPVAGSAQGGAWSILASLTEREHELLALLRTGASTAQIAIELAISPNTVRTHVQNLTGKLGVRSRLEAVAMAERHDPRRDAGSARASDAATDAPCVVVVASHPIHGAALAAALEADGIVAATVAPRVAVDSAGMKATDVVLLATEPAGAATTLCAAIKEAEAPPRVVVVGSNLEDASLREAVQAGADGYLAAAASVDELSVAVRQVARGEAYVPAAMLGTLLRDLILRRREEDAVTDRFARLSRREREVLSLLADGLDHEEIGGRLYLSPHTTRTHIQNVLRKLEVHSRLEAVTLATRHRLLERFTPTDGD